jgi:hypothetical protein
VDHQRQQHQPDVDWQFTIGPNPPVALNPKPSYTQTNALNGLGSGAVGLVPFRMYFAEMPVPNGGSTSLLAHGDTLTLRFYGPVQARPGVAMPVQIRRRLVDFNGVPGAWQLMSNQFTATISNRELVLTRHLLINGQPSAEQYPMDGTYEWQVQPTTTSDLTLPNNRSAGKCPSRAVRVLGSKLI